MIIMYWIEMNKNWKTNYQHFVSVKPIKIKIINLIFAKFVKDLIKIKAS